MREVIALVLTGIAVYAALLSIALVFCVGETTLAVWTGIVGALAIIGAGYFWSKIRSNS